MASTVCNLSPRSHSKIPTQSQRKSHFKTPQSPPSFQHLSQTHDTNPTTSPHPHHRHPQPPTANRQPSQTPKTPHPSIQYRSTPTPIPITNALSSQTNPPHSSLEQPVRVAGSVIQMDRWGKSPKDHAVRTLSGWQWHVRSDSTCVACCEDGGMVWWVQEGWKRGGWRRGVGKQP